MAVAKVKGSGLLGSGQSKKYSSTRILTSSQSPAALQLACCTLRL